MRNNPKPKLEVCELCFWEGEGALNQNLGIRNLWLLLDTFLTSVVNSFFFFINFFSLICVPCGILLTGLEGFANWYSTPSRVGVTACESWAAHPQRCWAWHLLCVKVVQKLCCVKHPLRLIQWDAQWGLGTLKILFPSLQCSGIGLFRLRGVGINTPTVMILQDSFEQC